MFLDVIFPNRCLSCDLIIHKELLICEICTEKLSFTHFSFDQDNLLYIRASLLYPIEKAYALFYFKEGNLAQKLIHGLKYGQQEFIAKHFAQWITERITLEEVNEIITVPLHPKKLKKRGYNQLTLFGNTLAKAFNLPIDHQFLKRNTHDDAQARKNKLHRENSTTLFSCKSSMSYRHILLVDDVFTTGNTLSTIAWEIKRNNPNYSISFLVIAVD